ncbi:MAG: BatA domain-containing protein, partial [Planctomycetota bacterium]
MLAAFVTPTLAWLGAGAVAAPILIHLLARRRFKRIRWAAMDFLIDAERRNRRRIRMEEWILLALRCLAVALLGLMVARPFMTPSGLASAWGGSRRTERVFVLDDSFSMGYQSPGATPFERAKSAVRRLIDSIRRDTPDDTVTVLRMSDPSKPVESGASLDSEGAEELLARLEALSPSQRSIDLSAVFEGVVESLQRDPGVVNVAVYLISDFQRKDWVQREGDSAASRGDAGVAASLADWASKQRGLRLVLMNLGESEAANTAVTEAIIQSGQLVAGTTGTVRANVVNYSNRTVENLELQTSVGNKSQTPKTIPSLAEHQNAVVDLEVDFPRPGDESVRVEIPRDALPIDNVRYVASEVVSAVRILLVNGEPSADEYDDEVALLTTALRPEGEVFSGHEVVVVDEPGLADANLAGFHAVVLANVYRISEPTIESLERFVRQG